MKKIIVLLVMAAFAFPVTAFAQTKDMRPIYYIESDPGADCTGALDKDEGCTITLRIRGQVSFEGPTKNINEGRVRSISIISAQNLAWDVIINNQDTLTPDNIDADSYVDHATFTIANGILKNPSPTTLERWIYAQTGLDIPYRDQDTIKESGDTGSALSAQSDIHLRLVNRTDAQKLAGANGAIKIRIGFGTP